MIPQDRKFYEHRDASGTLVRVWCCPCCGYPTVGEPPSYDICRLCSWQDDGCEGGGPNACGLEEARGYFQRYLTSFSPTHEFSPQFQRPGHRFVHQEELKPENLERKHRLMADLERYRTETNPDKRGGIWRQIRWMD